MDIVITEHAQKRLQDLRQSNIQLEDVYRAANSIPGLIPRATRFRGFISRKSRIFDIVVKDIDSGRLIITIIGQ